MSTFKGIIAEFPQIRIDYFRQQSEHKPPLACFLSHVHSDHLTGLESLRAPFVYCSAATREILLRLEKYHYRMNFAKGVLESRNVTYDRNLKKIARPLPLDTPTRIELAPENNIQVTLIDANHCIGAVMFLVEGNGKAILYTGDIRAETWWVNSLVQNPVLLPYATNHSNLDCIYLDTTFATKKEPYQVFPSKADGIRELLDKVREHSDDTVFYFHAWTFGYENVWIALSSFLGSRIHLDDYRARIYGSLSTLDRKALREVGFDMATDNKFLRQSGLEIREAPALCGFKNGNHIQPGCLTSQENVRIHSCERGAGCPTVDNDAGANLVHIVPIITRTRGVDIVELGAGGGKGDLDQKEEIETESTADVSRLMELCAASITDEKLLEKVLALLQKTLTRGDSTLQLGKQLQQHLNATQEDTSIRNLVSVLSSHVADDVKLAQPRGRTIQFPYSRHSSYQELCELIGAFQPRDVFPCTVDELHWTPDVSMRNLFGHLCSDDRFQHDSTMMRSFESRVQSQFTAKRDRQDTQEYLKDTDEDFMIPIEAKRVRSGSTHSGQSTKEGLRSGNMATSSPRMHSTIEILHTAGGRDTVHSVPAVHTTPSKSKLGTQSCSHQVAAKTPQITTMRTTNIVHVPLDTHRAVRTKPTFTNRELAYHAAVGIDLTWSDFGGLVSTRSKADREEREL
ncbi:hypothetical protein ACN47E_006983 [Coniothyrium glycines]